MKLRLYLNDFTLCADIEWSSPFLPQKDEIILLQEFISLNKGESNVRSFTDFDGKCGVFNVSQYDRFTDKEYLAVKEMKEVRVSSPIIWRKIDGVIIPCMRVIAVNDHGINDANFPNEQMN